MLSTGTTNLHRVTLVRSDPPNLVCRRCRRICLRNQTIPLFRVSIYDLFDPVEIHALKFWQLQLLPPST